MISQTAEYALRAVVFMAEHSHTLHTTAHVAKATHVPAGYLSKVLQSLQRAGLVNSHRGLGGGFSLVKPPAEITVYDIIQCVDPMRRICSCPLKLPAHREGLCPLHRRLDDAMALIERSFRETTIAELLAQAQAASAGFIFPYKCDQPQAAGHALCAEHSEAGTP